MLELSLYFKCVILSHLENGSDEDLEFDDVTDHDECKNLLFLILILHMPIVLDNVVYI